MFPIDTVPAMVTSLTGIGSDNNCITRGQDSMLRCTYGGVPAPTRIWYKGTGGNRMNIPVSNADYVVEDPSTTETVLTIRNVGDDDMDTYGCETSNTINDSTVMGRMELAVVICCKQNYACTFALFVCVEMFCAYILQT